MVDNRTMEELLQAPTEGYGEAIIIPEINVDHFEIKMNLLQLVQANPYHGFKRENPYTHISNFKRITSTLKFREVPNDVIKLMIFSYSLEGNARVWMNTTSKDNASKLDDGIDKHADQISTLVDIFAKKVVAPAPVNAVEESYVTCGGAHAYYNCPNTDSNQPSVCVATDTYNQNQSSTSGTLPSNTIPNPKGEMKAITTRSGVVYEGPLIPTPKKVVERETKETTDKEQSNFQGSTAYIQSPVTPIPEPDVPKTLHKPNIPYPSRLNDQKLREKATNLMDKFFQIFQDLHFDISFADALILMLKFSSTIKSLLRNKDKLFELAKIPLKENCSVMLLKKLPEKLRDPGKFLIPCDFLGMVVCHALADLGASINLMPLSILKKLSLPKLTPTRMSLELADRSITLTKGVAEDVFVKVGKFHFLTDFVVVDFEADPREILGFPSNSSGGNPTSTFEPILSDSSPSLTPFERSDFILEEIDAYLKDESVSPEIDHADCDPEGYICLIEKLLNDDLFQLLLMDLKQGEAVKAKSSIEEPPELELKELPPHLEYAYLKGADKLPVIISKDLKIDEKEALLKVLKSHKRMDFMVTFKFQSIRPTKKRPLSPVPMEHLLIAECPLAFAMLLGHFKDIMLQRLKVDRSKVDVIDKLPYPTTVKGVRSFLGHAGFYRIFIQDFPKIARPMTHLLEKETPSVFSKDCIDAFETLKKKLTEALILVFPDWNASDFAIGAVLGQRKTKHFQPIHYASKTMTKAQIHYTTTKKEMLVVV
nr:reverse transcriptase domain-containing protein [Tanacetum cinerariifolium]